LSIVAAIVLLLFGTGRRLPGRRHKCDMRMKYSTFLEC
jgi:hypothetical protein